MNPDDFVTLLGHRLPCAGAEFGRIWYRADVGPLTLAASRSSDERPGLVLAPSWACHIHHRAPSVIVASGYGPSLEIAERNLRHVHLELVSGLLALGVS